MVITTHASARLRQRAVPHELLSLLNEFGRKKRVSGGAIMRYFDARSRARMRAAVGRTRYANIEKKTHVYTIEAEGRLITVGYRMARVRN